LLVGILAAALLVLLVGSFAIGRFAVAVREEQRRQPGVM
jgi:hypothetical protein